MPKSPIEVFRIISHLEGFSFLILLGIAMPLKYVANIPQVVSVVGMIHGILFILYIAAVIYMKMIDKWGMYRTIGALAASVVPFGNFVLDSKLRQSYPELKQTNINIKS